MRCEPNVAGRGVETRPQSSKRPFFRRKLPMLAATLLAALAVACGYGSTNYTPPPTVASEIFLVSNSSGDVSAFSAASGKLDMIAGSSAMFPPVLTQFAAEPTGMFLAAVSTAPTAVATLQIANIAAGGKITVAPLMNVVNHPVGLAISSLGVIAVTDTLHNSVQLMRMQNNALMQGASAATGALPVDAAFSSDGSRLYVANSGDGTISVFTVSMQSASLQLMQTAALPVAAGEFLAAPVRVALSPAGNKFAATTPDGRLFVGNVSAMNGMLSGLTETQVAANANLEEVVFDPSGQNVYTGDQDNGGIFAFTVNAGSVATPIAGSPFPTVALPGGPTGMAFNSAGDHLYVVIGAQSAVYTFSRNAGNGSLTATGDVVSSGGILAGRIVRVAGY